MSLAGCVLAEELRSPALIVHELPLEFILNSLDFAVHRVLLEQGLVEQPCLHIERLLEGLVVHLELILGELILCVVVVVASIR